MKIVILIGSARKGGNTDLLAHAFAEGAAEHNEVEFISVGEVNVMNSFFDNMAKLNANLSTQVGASVRICGRHI